MPNILAVARIVSQILRDMPTNGTGEIRTSVLAEIAGVQPESLPSLQGDVLTELELRVLESDYSVDIRDDVTTVTRCSARRGAFTFQATVVAADLEGLEERERLAGEIFLKIPECYRNDAAGRRRIVEVLLIRPASEVEDILESAFWIARKTKKYGFWQLAMQRFKFAANDLEWSRRLVESQGSRTEQQKDLDMLIATAGPNNPRMESRAQLCGIFPSRVNTERALRKAQELVNND
jgi:hypothetical protein